MVDVFQKEITAKGHRWLVEAFVLDGRFMCSIFRAKPLSRSKAKTGWIEWECIPQSLLSTVPASVLKANVSIMNKLTPAA